MDKVLAFLFVVGLMILVVAGLSALVAWVAMILFNYIAVQTHHQDAQISFWVAWAAMFLLGIIARPFRVTVSKKDE
jgi:hypothetical protein